MKVPRIRRIFYSVVPFRFRYEKTFRKTLSFLKKSNKEEINNRSNYQFEELKKLLVHSYQSVSYYRNLFDKIRFNPEEFKSFSEMERIPFLTKEIIVNNFDELQSDRYSNAKKYEITTSGSTGKKLKLLVTDDVFKKEAAFVLNAYHAHGATLYNKPSAWLRRYVPENESDSIYKYDFELKRMYMSAYHLNENSVYSYFKVINERKFHTLVGYPSSIYLLALLAESANLKFDHIKSIHVASEMMLPMWRDKIREVFNLIPYAHYGQMEKVVFMHQKDKTGFYVNNPEYGYTELIGNGDQFEIIGTGFINYAMPLIRYKTNDLAIGPSYQTGKLIGVESIIGRNDDFLTAAQGNRIPGVNFYSWVNKNLPSITLFQIRQLKDRKILFKFVSKGNNLTELVQIIKDGLTARLGNVEMEIEQVESILRDPNSNKLRAIISEV